jgi:quercetin dioxygenase-like cupin family protein
MDGRNRRESSAKGDVAFLPADAPTMLRLEKDDPSQVLSYSYLVFETLPGKRVPLHIHPFSEFFYVLEGRLDVMTLDLQGMLKWIELKSGHCVNAPATTPHGLKNRSEKEVKFLSVANYEHQRPFDDYQDWLATQAGALANTEQRAETLMKIFEGYKIQFFDIDDQ